MIVVSGLMRSGTSMMMQMLHAAGIQCLGAHPWYEDSRSAKDIIPQELVDEAHDKAFKFLCPCDRSLPPHIPDNTVFVWMDRRYREEAKSYIKFLKIMYPHLKKRDFTRRYRALRGGELSQQRNASLDVLRQHGKRIIKVQFEDVIKNPLNTAEGIAAWLNLPDGSGERMASVVLERDAKCAPRMLEAEL